MGDCRSNLLKTVSGGVRPVSGGVRIRFGGFIGAIKMVMMLKQMVIIANMARSNSIGHLFNLYIKSCI